MTAQQLNQNGSWRYCNNKGEYDKAVNFFGTEPCFNLALAQLLKGM